MNMYKKLVHFCTYTHDEQKERRKKMNETVQRLRAMIKLIDAGAKKGVSRKREKQEKKRRRKEKRGEWLNTKICVSSTSLPQSKDY